MYWFVMISAIKITTKSYEISPSYFCGRSLAYQEIERHTLSRNVLKILCDGVDFISVANRDIAVIGIIPLLLMYQL